MGIIRNIALRTAIRKALLDVDKEIEAMRPKLPSVGSFGEAVMIYAKHNPSIDKDLIAGTWEGTFCGIVAHRAQKEMPSNYLIQSQQELAKLISLISEWVASHGGNAINIYREFGENLDKQELSSHEVQKTNTKDRFISYDDGTVLDTQTKLMWASQDNGSNIDWVNAKSYCCQKYRGGGYIDWRMPTQDELAGLYESGAHKDRIKLTMTWVWASETRGSSAAYVGFGVGERDWGPQSVSNTYRALPVRSVK